MTLTTNRDYLSKQHSTTGLYNGKAGVVCEVRTEFYVLFTLILYFGALSTFHFKKNQRLVYFRVISA